MHYMHLPLTDHFLTSNPSNQLPGCNELVFSDSPHLELFCKHVKVSIDVNIPEHDIPIEITQDSKVAHMQRFPLPLENSLNIGMCCSRAL